MPLENTTYVILFVAICMLIEMFAEIALNFWAKPNAWHQHYLPLVVGILLYALIGYVYGTSLRYGSVTIANCLWQCFSIIFIGCIGVLIFGDKPTRGQWWGMAIVLVGTVLMVLASPERWVSLPDSWFEKIGLAKPLYSLSVH